MCVYVTYVYFVLIYIKHLLIIFNENDDNSIFVNDEYKINGL